MTAPIWSMASCSPKPNPLPSGSEAAAINESRDGARTALPRRSATTSAIARSIRPTRPSSGTATTVSTYPPIVIPQYAPVRSAMRPVRILSAKPTNSPIPEMRPTAAALAPRVRR